MELRVKTGKDDRDRSNHWHNWVFRYVLGTFAVVNVSFWQWHILDIVKSNGTGHLALDTTVLVTLLTTTTINVFAFLIIVMKFVFPTAAEK